MNIQKEEYYVTSYKEMIELAKKLREKDKDKPYTIHIDGQQEEIGNFKFPYSDFHIINHGNRLISRRYAKEKDENGNELTTWKTAALKITGDNNTFENLIIENRAGHPETKGQEVALGVYGDHNTFISCEFSSTQDTLFVGPLPDDLSTRYLDFLPEDERYHEGNTMNYFSHCIIKGTVDFIFGAGQAIFDTCRLITVYDKRGETYVVAGSQSLKDNFGYLFEECSFEKGNDVNENSTYLARPWRDYAKNVFHNCRYDDHIRKEGFSDWSDVNRTRTARYYEYPYQEGRVSWIKTGKEDTIPKRYLDAVRELRERLRKKMN